MDSNLLSGLILIIHYFLKNVVNLSTRGAMQGIVRVTRATDFDTLLEILQSFSRLAIQVYNEPVVFPCPGKWPPQKPIKTQRTGKRGRIINCINGIPR